MARADDATELAEALLISSRALVGVAARSLAGVDAEVTLVQYRALVVLATKGPLHVGELAAVLGIHRSTATRLCDRLVDLKLVRRSVDRGNRRETSITLLPRGQNIVDDVSAVRRREIREIVARIPADLRQPAIDAMNAFAQAAGEVSEAWKLGWS